MKHFPYKGAAKPALILIGILNFAPGLEEWRMHSLDFLVTFEGIFIPDKPSILLEKFVQEPGKTKMVA